MKCFAIVIGIIGAVFAVIDIAAIEIGKFVEDISPYDWNDFDHPDVGEDFESMDCPWK